MTDLRLDKVSKSFARHPVLEAIDLSVASGELCVVLGPSGCGKSTLLRLVAGLEEVDRGRIYLGGRDVTDLPPKARDVAMVFQSYALYPHMSAYQNMAFGLRLAGRGRAEVARRVREVARALHIETLLERRPAQLSGGQRQRVAIGRAIVREPRAFLFDEPLSNLDADLRGRMRLEIARLHRRLGATMLYVTHDQVEAMTLADRLVVMNAGRIAQVGAPLDLYHHPADLFVAGFLGSPRMNRVAARLLEVGPNGVTVLVGGTHRLHLETSAGRARPGDELTVGVRPEHLRLGGEGENALGAEVSVVEHLGDQVLAYLEWAAGADPLVLRLPGSGAPRVGERLKVSVPSGQAHLFDAGGRALGA